jgi:hypothetical protein
MDNFEKFDPLANRPPDQEKRFAVTIDLLKIWRWYKNRRDKVDDAGVCATDENHAE